MSTKAEVSVGAMMRIVRMLHVKERKKLGKDQGVNSGKKYFLSKIGYPKFFF